MKIYVVEMQSAYDGGGTLAVFDSEEKARKYIETQKDFTEWHQEYKYRTKVDKYDFYYEYQEYILNKED